MDKHDQEMREIVIDWLENSNNRDTLALRSYALGMLKKAESILERLQDAYTNNEEDGVMKIMREVDQITPFYYTEDYNRQREQIRVENNNDGFGFQS